MLCPIVHIDGNLYFLSVSVFIYQALVISKVVSVLNRLGWFEEMEGWQHALAVSFCQQFLGIQTLETAFCQFLVVVPLLGGFIPVEGVVLYGAVLPVSVNHHQMFVALDGIRTV